MRRRFIIALLGALPMWHGCSDDEASIPVGTLDRSVVLGTHVALIDAETDRAFVLDVTAQSVAEATPVPTVRLAPNPTLVEQRRGDSDEALILSGGRRGVASEAVLTVLGADTSTRQYPVDAPFSALAQSPDGEVAVAFFATGAHELLFSPTELAVIDLDGGSTVERRSVRMPGGPPLGVAISPLIKLGDESLHVAVIPSTSHVTLLDVDEPTRKETVVQLSTGALVGVDPDNALFGVESGRIYLRERGGEDVFVLELTARDDEGDSNRFSTAIVQLSGGGPISDMAIYEQAGAERLVTVQRDRDQIRVTDPRNQQHFDLPLDQSATRLTIYRGFEDRPVAVLYDEGSRWLTFVDLVAAETGGASRFSVRLAEPVSDMLGVLQERLIVFRHGTSVLSIVDVEDRSIRLLSVNGDLDDAVYDDALGNLWIAPEGQHFVGVLDLLTGQTSEVLLDAPVQRLITAPDANRVVVIHGGEPGTVTLLDAHDPSRSTSLVITEFH